MKNLVYLTVFLVVSGCTTFYRVNTSSYPEAEKINAQISENRIFVIHADSEVFIINNLQIENDSVKGNYIMDYKFPSYTSAFPLANKQAVKYRKNEERMEREVHIYLGSNTPGAQAISKAKKGENIFSTGDIYRYDVYNRNMNATIFTYALGVLAVVAVSGLIILGGL